MSQSLYRNLDRDFSVDMENDLTKEMRNVAQTSKSALRKARSNPWSTIGTLFTTFIVLSVCLLLVGIPPLYMTSRKAHVVFVAVLIPVLAVVGSILEYYAIGIPLRNFNRFLFRMTEGVYTHCESLSSQAKVPQGTGGLSPSTSVRSRTTPLLVTPLPDRYKNASSFSIEEEIRWVDDQIKELSSDKDASRPATLNHLLPLLHVFVSSFLEMQKGILLLLKVELQESKQRSEQLNTSVQDTEIKKGGAQSFVEFNTSSHRTIPDPPVFSNLEADKVPKKDSTSAGSSHEEGSLEVLKTVDISEKGPPLANLEGLMSEGDDVKVDISSGTEEEEEGEGGEKVHTSGVVIPANPSPQTHSRQSSKTVLTQRPPTITLKRGNRFYTDSPSVFFYVVISSLNASGKSVGGKPKIIGFDANLKSSGDSKAPVDGSGCSPLFKPGSNSLPYRSFFLNGQTRHALTIMEQRMVEFIYCKIEDRKGESTPTDLSSLAVKVSSSSDALATSGVTGSASELRATQSQEKLDYRQRKLMCEPFDSAESFVMGWALLPNLPMRLTFLYVELQWEASSVLSPPPEVPEELEKDYQSNSTGNSKSVNPPQWMCVPVMECMIDNTFCVLLGSKVFTNSSGVPVSVELFGVSIEDETNSQNSSELLPGSSPLKGKLSVGSLLRESFQLDPS